MLHACCRSGFVGTVMGLALSLGAGWGTLGCGDDSEVIEKHWPNWTAGNVTAPSSQQTSSAPVQTTDAGSKTTVDSSGPGSSGASTSTPSNTSTATSTGTLAPTACTPDRYRCVAPLPAGWSGPIARKAKNAQGLVPRCDDEYRFEVNALPYHTDPQFQAASCSPCSCGTPTGATCSDVSGGKFFKEPGCVAADELTDLPTMDSNGTCSEVLNAVGWAKSVKVPSPVIDMSKVSCPANGGFATKTAFSWGKQERLCRSRGSESLQCADASQLCVPKVASSFTQGVCIYRDGDHACPAQGYTQRTLLYKGENDSRGCEACTCSTVNGTLSCKGFLMMYSDNQCPASGGTRESVELNTSQADTCGDVNNFIAPAGIPKGVALDVWVDGLNAASCTAGGGMATGLVEGTDPVTLCCTVD